MQKVLLLFTFPYRTDAIKSKKVLYGFAAESQTVQNKKQKTVFVLYKMKERSRTKRENCKKFGTNDWGQFSLYRTKRENEI